MARWHWVLAAALLSGSIVPADEIAVVSQVEAQPLGANCERLLQALEFLGRPAPADLREAVLLAVREGNATALQQALDRHVLCAVHINPEYRVKVQRGPADARLLQHGYTPVLVKIANEALLTERLRIYCPQAGPVYAGAARLSLERQQQTELNDNENTRQSPGRIFEVELVTSPPMTPRLSGLPVEYAIALVYCTESGRREATIAFDVGQGTQDIGFRGETPILFDVRPAVPVTLSIRDHDGQPTVARLTFRDRQGHVYPPQAKRLAPDFFFQPQIYREDGDTLLLSPGTYLVSWQRGPEYLELTREVEIPDGGPARLDFALQRWVNPMEFGFYSGDHHIHGAGCAHYQVPTQGVSPRDMFLQVKGEGLNVGCVLTWGPCFDYQRQYFSPVADQVSEPLTRLKYDLEISGFGSAPLGHVCLLNLTNQTYPGSEGATLGWPTWTVPVLRWAKQQGGVTGYPHSDMRVDPPAYAKRLIRRHDTDRSGLLDPGEAEQALLAEPFHRIDADEDRRLSLEELQRSADRAANQLPNLVLPSMGGAGAMEVFVSTAEGVCDFTSAMDTGRIGEWNTWYHILNCGFPLKLSGETDFPCMSSRSVGQGRTYVKLADGALDAVDFGEWCQGVAAGRSYVSDGYAHALRFSVNGQSPGTGEVALARPGQVNVRATVVFAPRLPRAVAYGTQETEEGRREVGDTRVLHAPRNEDWIEGGERLVELVRNGIVVAQTRVPADGGQHDLSWMIDVDRSSWIALRQFPQLHTNPVNVLVSGEPIRASRASARWCSDAIELLWENRSRLISEGERPAAKAAYDRAVAEFRRRGDEAGSE